MSTIVIEDGVVRTETPEGRRLELPLEQWLAGWQRPRFDHGCTPLPRGTVAFSTVRDGVILAHESAPCVRRLLWLAEDSPEPFGSDAVYREVALALPFVVVLAVFLRDESGRLRLSQHSEAFFRNGPLTDGSDPLHYPALPNCSRVSPNERRPLSWICVQHLKLEGGQRGQDDVACLRHGLSALLTHFYLSGFNRSSEVHEGSSWWEGTRKAGVDPRLADLASWERASAEDPSFAVEVPWISTGLSLTQMFERMARRLDRHEDPLPGIHDLLRPLLNDSSDAEAARRLRRRLLTGFDL